MNRYHLTWDDGSAEVIEAPSRDAAINMSQKGPPLTAIEVTSIGDIIGNLDEKKESALELTKQMKAFKKFDKAYKEFQKALEKYRKPVDHHVTDLLFDGIQEKGRIATKESFAEFQEEFIKFVNRTHLALFHEQSPYKKKKGK